MYKMECRPHKIFNLARNVSKLSNITKHNIGAVLVAKNGDVLGVGANVRKTHPLQAELAAKVGLEHKIFLHAELQCLINAKRRDVRGARLFIYREFVDGGTALARPCPICMAGIKRFGIKEIVYTTPDGYATEYVK